MPVLTGLKFGALSPMLASIGDDFPGTGWAYEPKYDGIRVLALGTPTRTTITRMTPTRATSTRVHLVTRNHKDKAAQFPEITEALQHIADRLRTSFVLDGELVALQNGAPARFQQLQPRIHVRGEAEIAEVREKTPVAFIVFDMLAYDDTSLLQIPWSERRDLLERLFARRWPQSVRAVIWLGDTVREPEQATGKKSRSQTAPSGQALLERARQSGWEGIIAKQMKSIYTPGARTPWWRKLKVEYRQEFVVGGYTDPRRSRPYLGALLLGYYVDDTLVYAGHTGSGFDVPTLRMLYHRLERLAQPKSPFRPPPRANERPHWVRPELIVEVKFTQWTDDGRLRHPIFLGVREDIDPRRVKREAQSMQYSPNALSGVVMSSVSPTRSRASTTSRKTTSRTSMSRASTSRTTPATKALRTTRSSRAIPSVRTLDSIVRQIDQAERAGEGIISVRRGQVLAVTNVNKVLFPNAGYTKGDLLRYYTRVAPFILPAVDGRPLVLKRFPDGIAAEGFYQHKAGNVPAGVRTEQVHLSGHDRTQIIGGDLLTLLYTIQLGSISVDPWHSRVSRTEYADYAVIDLDPGKRAPFKAVVAVARYVKESLDELGLHGAVKTSGATGLHIYLPLPARTSNASAQLVAELVATHVAAAHPTEATVERMVKRRKATAVYVDYLQNILGKTVAGPYSVRALPDAPVSTPLEWDELTDSLDPTTFTIATVFDRFSARGDIWAARMRRPNPIEGL